MSRFEVHESVTRVYLTGNQEPDPRRVAVPVEDVPGIVRAEVERAWHWWHESDPNGVMPLEASFVDYLAARFGEESPSPHWGRDVAGPTERLEPELHVHPGLLGQPIYHGSWEGCPYCGKPEPFPESTPADRDRLARLERFCKALAKQQLDEYGWVAGREGVDPAYEMLKAAREFLEDK